MSPVVRTTKMRRTILLGVLGSGLLLAGAATLPRQSAHAAQTYEMKIGTVAPGDGTPWESQLHELKDYLEGASNGQLQVRAFMGGSLGGEKALVRRTAQSSLQCFAGTAAALGTMVPALNVLESPYLFEDEAEADRALDGPAKAIVSRALEAKGFRFGAWAENGYRSWFTKERAIRQPSDLQGLRMRSQEAIVHLETYRAFGANPVPIDITNVLTSLQTGVVDGFDNTPLYAFASSWYQSVKHVNLSRHSYQPGMIVYSKRWFDSLPANLQQILANIPDEIVRNGRQGVRRMTPILLRNLARRGVTVHKPSAEERARFAALARGVPAKVAKKVGRRGRALLRAVREP